MDIVGTVGASLQFASIVFKALQTVDGVWRGKSSEPVVTMELLCDKVRKECETFVQENTTNVDACNIAKQGLAICNELTATIDKMHPAEKTAKTLSRAVFRTLWSKDKLVEQQRNLDSCMQALERLTLRQFEDDTGRALQHISHNNDAILDIAQLYKQATQHRKASRILDALAFEGLGRRYGEVHWAEANTFRWVLDLEEQASLAMWLAYDDGIFHIIGKPGSGKSTLMKYIVDEPSTTDLLRQWADGAKLVHASCFFWKPGNALQRTTMGLVRTLLHGMLRANPNLAKTLFSDVWEDLGVGAESHFQLSDRVIKDAWTRLISGGDDGDGLSDYRCCFFIDGLDEFGDRNDTIPRLVHELKKMVQSAGGRIKICVSSREYPEIVDGLATKDTHRILLQDLTRGDIARFVDRRLQDICDEVPIDSSDIQQLRRNILRGAQGVFLWVAIVLGIVESEAWNGTSVDGILAMIHEAQHDELDDFLRSVVSRMQKHNRKKVAILLKYTVEVSQFRPYNRLFGIQWYMFLQEFDTADNFATQCSKVQSQLSVYESYMARKAATCNWIKRSCEGLLDVQYSESYANRWRDPEHLLVAVTHRSVHEFILALLADEWHHLVAGFDLTGAIVRMAYAYTSFPWAERSAAKEALYSYFKMQTTDGSDNTASMHENFAIALATEQAIADRADPRAYVRKIPLATKLATKSLCHQYIEWKNKRCPRELVGWSALKNIPELSLSPALAPTVWQLLESGASPMDVVDEIPYWLRFLIQLFHWKRRGQGLTTNMAAILEMLVRVPGPLPMWIWAIGKDVAELDDCLYYYNSPWSIPPLGERSESSPLVTSCADFVMALDPPNRPALLALLDKREPVAVRAERAQRLVQDLEHISAQLRLKLEATGTERIGFLIRKFGTLTTR